MTSRQTTLDVRPDERVGDALARIRRDATSEAEKGRWFEHLFMATVRDNAEFDVAGIWPSQRHVALDQRRVRAEDLKLHGLTWAVGAGAEAARRREEGIGLGREQGMEHERQLLRR